MKKRFNKVKSSIAACGIAIITFLSKTKGEILEENIQDVYGPTANADTSIILITTNLNNSNQ